MLRLTLLILLSAGALVAQQAPAKQDMQVRVNVLNVCAPDQGEKQAILTALDRIPVRPHFNSEFEVARGRSVEPDAPPADWVRIRREFTAGEALSNVQYSISADSGGVVETVVFRWRDPNQALQLSLEAKVTAAGSPAAVVATDTPAGRIRVERFGRNSLGLARCPSADQSMYEALFAKASGLMAVYRTALNVRRTVPRELSRLAATRTASRAKASKRNR